MEGHLQSAMKAVGQAIKLDGDGNSKEAYFRYLACIHYISQVLLEEAKDHGYQGPVKTKSTQRMVKLSQQCMDRTSAIMEVTVEGQSTQLAPPPNSQSGRFSPSISFSSPQPSQSSTVEWPKQDSATSLPVPMGYMRPAARKDKLTPLEAAYLENRRLMNSYKVRMMKLMETTRGRGKQNKTNLNLTLQRRLMENMAIARAREAALAKKIQERHQRLQEEAVRRFSTTGEPTKTEIELRQIYASVMEFENNEVWLLEWRQKLRESPKDLEFIHALISHILACPNHPFTQLLKKFQYSVYQSLLPLVRKDAETLEQIKVPYKMVEPLVLTGSQARVIPANGFAAPEDLDKNVDEDLIRRLHALRNSSHEDQRESLYGDMLASSSSIDEDEEDDMWDELNSGDDTLEDNIGDEMENTDEQEAIITQSENEIFIDDICDETPRSCRLSEEETKDGEVPSRSPQIPVGESGDEDRAPKSSQPSDEEWKNEEEASNSGDASSRNPEVPIGESGDESRALESNVPSDEERKDDEAEDTNLRYACSKSQDGESHDQGDRMANGGITQEETYVARGEENSEDIAEDEFIDEMKRISLEVREDLEDSLIEVDKLTKDLEEHVAEDLAAVEGKINGVADVKNSSESDDGSEEIPGVNISDAEDEALKSNESRTVNSEEVSEEALDHNLESDSIPDVITGSDFDQTNELAVDSEGALREDAVSENSRRDGNSESKEETGNTEKTEEEQAEERITRLQEEALQRHLKHISKDIQSYLDRLQSLLVAVYEELDSAVAKEKCIAIIEKHFFRYIWQPLLTLFRRANLRKEIAAATAMTKYQNALPENIGITKKLCLMEDAVKDESSYPYQLAVEELRRISGYYSPLDKLECVVKASKAIITCIGDFYEAQGGSRENSENAVGCDDLLPILSFVVIKSALPHLVSECSVMEEFIHEGYLLGQEGYCLTTLQTSLGYVLKLSED